MIRNYAEVLPLALSCFGGNGYSLADHAELVGAPEPVHVSGQPAAGERPRRPRRCAGLLAEGRPVTSGRRPPWSPTPAPPSRRTTTSSSVSRILTEYVWGRQVGENTINP